MTTTEVFKKNLKAYLDGYRLIINKGGQASGKTYAILQMLAYISVLSKKKLHIIIASYALPHLKSGAIKTFDVILENIGINLDNVKNRSEYRYYINNSMIEFFGIEGKEAKAHSLRPDIVFINEANLRVTWEVFKQFYSRAQRCTIIDFNPSREFWLNEHILGKEKNYIVINSTYLDNKYISQNEFEFIHEKRNKPGWENWYKVYGLGEWGQIEDAIFTNWQYGEFNDTLPFGYGLDFGVKDPDACVKVAIDKKNKKIYCDEVLYKNSLSIDELISLLKIRTEKNKIIYCDTSDIRVINELRKKGLNAVPVKKSRVIDDIKIVKNYDIVITEKSYNLAKELKNYVWLDKKGEIPVDEMNHLIDAMRYYVTMIVNKKKHVLT